MNEVGTNGSSSELIENALAEVDPFVQTVTGRENDPAMAGYAEYGVPWQSGACQTVHGLHDTATYRQSVSYPNCAAWMDNTTLVTAATLMSKDGPEVVTPLTVWDLVTFARAAVCFDRIYHHEHPRVDDSQMNAILGTEVLIPVPLPLRATAGNSPLPDPWDGAHRFMCDIWMDGYGWLRRLHDAVGTSTLDGEQVAAVAESWRFALHQNDLGAEEIVNFRDVNTRWISPSNRLLIDTANATDLDDTRIYIDPQDNFRRQHQLRREAGLKDDSRERLGDLLSDLNLRSYINQRLADFFQLPYICSAARVPFRRYLYDRAVRVQQDMTTMKVIEDRYAELSGNVQLRLPVFLAIALPACRKPDDLWNRLAELRKDASKFRACRAELDAALARQNLKEVARVSKALHLTVDELLTIVGGVSVAVGTALVDDVAHGDINAIKTGISATVAAGRELLRSSFTQRLLWRLRRPHLLWLNNLVDQAQQLTEALPDFSRIWQIPGNQQVVFAKRFTEMGRLGG